MPQRAWPEGFSYAEEAISPAAEAKAVAEIQKLPLKEFQFRGYEGKRRVVSFGWRYDFNEHKLQQAEPIPDFLLRLHEEVARGAKFDIERVAQVLVTEYAPGAGIGWHKDRPMFGEVLGVSLNAPCLFRLRRKEGDKWERMSLHAAPRSAYRLEGPVRWDWEHSIPAVSELRYSVTFRNFREDKPGPYAKL